VGKSILAAPDLGIHKIEEQSDEHLEECDFDFKQSIAADVTLKPKAQSGSGYSEEDEGESLLKNYSQLAKKRGI
jgi:hypothetical protein